MKILLLQEGGDGLASTRMCELLHVLPVNSFISFQPGCVYTRLAYC
jgi:hypothetical protein